MSEGNVDTAANKLPKEVRVSFKEAFYRCGVMDVYGGELPMYMAIIVQTIRDDKNRLAELRKVINISQMVIDKALKA
jgi:hypothetical protein